MAVSPAASGTTTPAVGTTTNKDSGVAQEITASAATNYHFVNWTADPAENAAFGNAASPSTAVTLTGSATVTANFTGDTYTVNFNAKGGTDPVPTNKQVTYGAAYGDLATTSRDGYVFNGWFTSETGGTEVTSATTVTTAGNHTLYAQWTINTYTVTTATNPTNVGTVTKIPDKPNYDHGENVQVTANANAGYTFTGWSGDLSVTNNPANLTMDGNKNVTANFASTYTVTYNGNGNTGGTPPVDGNAYQQGDQVTVLGNTGGLVKTGYTSNNWNTTADGNGTPYAPGDSFNMQAANVMLYAQWADGLIRYVCSDGDCGGKTQCHRTVWEAVEAADTGTLIKIAAEEHDGNFSLSVDKDLTLQGGWDKTFNNPNGGTTTLHGAPEAPQGSLTLQNLKIMP